MKLLSELFSDWVGLLSFIVIAFIVVMAVFFGVYFSRNMARDEAAAARTGGAAKS